jgi:hypothetical protein
MTDPIEQVLRLVAEGRLTAAEAVPILDALDADARDRAPAGEPAAGATGGDAGDDANRTSTGNPSSLRIEVSEGGRRVVNLRIPVPLGRMALDRIPGLAGSNADLIRQALADRRIGPLLTVDDDDGDGVRISLE